MISLHFAAREMDCPCGDCSYTLIDDQLMKQLDAVRDKVGVPLQITSGYRCPTHQKELAERGYETAKGISTHEQGMAADIKAPGISGITLEAAARASAFRAVGVGATWCHVDLRNDRDRSWSYKR